MQSQSIDPRATAKQLADAQRNEAKRLLGSFITNQSAADRIIDCIVGAAILEVGLAVSEQMAGARRG